MANPVALDLSAVKTLLAFGERAAKHGLVIPGDLQQFVDEPEKMARLVDYAKAGAPFYRVMLPDINWPLTYEKLGMTAEYREASKKLVLPEENPSLWLTPMIPGVTPNRVVASYRELKVDVWTYHNDVDANVQKNDHDPNKDGPYLAGFRRNIEADEEFANKSANQLAEIGHQGIVLVERLVLGFGFFVTTGQHLDVKTATLCTGSRCGDGDVPYVSFDPDRRGVYVHCYGPDGCIDGLRSRLAAFCSILPA